jgi:hypothetical protein
MIFFWAAPILGGALAALTFKYGFRSVDDMKSASSAAVADEASAEEAKKATPQHTTHAAGDSDGPHDQTHGTHAQSMGGAVFRRYSLAPSTLRNDQPVRRRIPTEEVATTA